MQPVTHRDSRTGTSQSGSPFGSTLPGPAIRPTRVEVSLADVCANAWSLATLAGTKVFAVVKADAYGHGAVPVAKALAASGAVYGFGVSLIEEGIELREAGIELPILVMGPSMAGGEEAVLLHGLWPMLSTLDAVRAMVEAAQKAKQSLTVHLKLDTGMGRLGLDRKDFASALALIGGGPLQLGGVSTHFACADGDDPDDPRSLTRTQLERFEAWVADAGIGAEVMRHVANSSATIRFPETRLDAVRPGLSLYGAGATAGDGRFLVTTRFVSAITQLRTADVGDSVSYGALWTASRPSKLAVVPVGYADGLPRSLTGRAQALVGGVRVPVVGTISMDITVLDVTGLPEARVGAEVVFLGAQGDEEITIPEFAGRAGISEYEVTCGISKRVPREYR